MVLDHHVHTQFRSLPTGDAFDLADRAAEKGIRVLGFAENFPLPASFALDVTWEGTMPPEDLPHYLDTALAIQVGKRSSGLEILVGVEVDWLPIYRREIGNRLDRLQDEIDFRLLGIHYLGTQSISFAKTVRDDLLFTRYGRAESPADEMFEENYGSLLNAVRTGLFDIVGHFDVIKKFDDRPGSELAHRHRRSIEKVLDALAAQRRVPIEINVSGLDSYCRDIFPSLPILEWAVDRGIPLTLGSDAATETHIGRHAEVVRSLLTHLGVSHLAFVRQRALDTLPIDEWLRAAGPTTQVEPTADAVDALPYRRATG